jgi:hypothetical protein
MESVATHAERVVPNFAVSAAEFIVEHLRLNGSMTSEELTDNCKMAGIVPHDDRAFGPVFYALRRKQLIHKIGTALRTKGHGTTGGNVWALVA